jgi:Domain of unknown function (DUF6379)
MFDKYMIVGEEFRNVEKDGKVTGFQVGLRLPYYRGIVISLVDPPQLTVDGETIAPERATVTLHGNTYKLAEMEDQDVDRWEFGEVGIVTVKEPGGLKSGWHEIDVEQHLKISYVPAGFRGHDHKVVEMAH